MGRTGLPLPFCKEKKNFWSKSTPIYLHMVCDTFPTTKAEWSKFWTEVLRSVKLKYLLSGLLVRNCADSWSRAALSTFSARCPMTWRPCQMKNPVPEVSVQPWDLARLSGLWDTGAAGLTEVSSVPIKQVKIGALIFYLTQHSQNITLSYVTNINKLRPFTWFFCAKSLKSGVYFALTAPLN